MDQVSRRAFLKASGVAAAGLGGGSAATAAAQDAVKAADSAAIPPHQTLHLPGVHAYAQRSVEAGGTIDFRISADTPYELSVCRLGDAIDDPASDAVLHTFDRAEPAPQPIHIGSYIHVAKALASDAAIKALTLEVWVKPWRLDAWQGLITQYDYEHACGVGLFIDQQGRAALYLGDGGAYVAERTHYGPRLARLRWTHIVGVYDGAAARLYIDGKPAGEWPVTTAVKPAAAPLRIGAYGSGGLASNTLDGDIAMPAIYGAALTAEQVAARFGARARGEAALPAGAVACWKLDEERGESVADATGSGRDGRIINGGTWMVGGPGFDGRKVGRFDTAYDPAKDPERGHALRLASDDLFDCRWSVSHTYTVPADAPSGLYVGRLRFERQGKPMQYDATFNVRRPRARAKAPILMLCSSNTWAAYSATPFAANAPIGQNWGTEGTANSHAAAPAYSCYRDHRAGQPAYKFGVNMPWPAAGPYVLYSPKHIGYSHLMRGERFAHVWLKQNNYAFDSALDHDLHREPAMLEGYKTVVINGHSEYWSDAMFDAVDKFLRAGGTAIVMSGNSIFWRVSFDEAGTVMECRKLDPSIGGRPAASVGELYHEHDKRRGSLLRDCGRPAWKLVGLDCVGWWGTANANDYGVYRVDEPDHFLFTRPHATGLKKGETFGHAPGGGLPRVGGHEADVRLPHLIAMTRNVPPGATLPEAEPAGIATLASIGGMPRGIDYFGHWTDSPHGLKAELIYFERPEGGRVVHFGAIAAGWALTADPHMQAVMKNTLHHFGVEPRAT